MRFIVKDKDSYHNTCVAIRDKAKEHKSIIVTICEKDDRSSAQNRLMHQWFKDIDKQTKSGVEYESGRCKLSYFLPVMGRSENKEVREACELLRYIYAERGREYLIKVLGQSLVQSTSLLSVKEFAEAMTEMYRSECGYNLTDPSMQGLDINWELVR